MSGVITRRDRIQSELQGVNKEVLGGTLLFAVLAMVISLASCAVAFWL